MILTDDSRPSHYTFANQVGIQTDYPDEKATTGVSEELQRTITSHLWLTNLEDSAGITPTMSLHASLPRRPHPDGPTQLTMGQLADCAINP